MKCFVTDGSGLNNLRIQDRPTPGPPGPGQVAVDVRAVSLNYRDLLVADGKYGKPVSQPIIACSDMAGIVAAVGTDVLDFQPGDRGVNCPFLDWPDGQLNPSRARTFVGAMGLDGVLAQKILYPAASLAKLPQHLDFQHACTLTVAGLSAWSAVTVFGQAQPNQWILAHGTGGVSLFAAKLAKLTHARVILSSSNPHKAQRAQKELAVDHVIDYRDPDWPQHVRQLTSGRGVDLIVETAGGQSLPRSINACAHGGRIALIGNLDSPDTTLNLFQIFSKRITLKGIYMDCAREMRRFAQAVEASGLRPVVDCVFEFDQTPDAFAHLRSGNHFGKVVIHVSA